VIAGEVLALDGHGAGVGVQSFRPGEEETEPGDESAPSPGPPVSSSPSDSERVLGARGGLEGDDSPVPGPVPRPPLLSSEGSGSRAEANADALQRIAVQSQQIQQLFRQLADRDTELLDAEARAEAAEQDRDDFRRAVTELEIRVRQLEERSADREELFAKALDLGVEHGVPGRDWPLESRAGGLATLFSRTTKRRSA
jgi:hypothetical protein